HAGALHCLIRTYEQLGRLDDAADAARRAVALDPLMEEARCALMRFHAAAGQPSAVRREFQELERVLKEELGEEPSTATRRLMESLVESAQERMAADGNGTANGETSTPNAGSAAVAPSAPPSAPTS